MSNNTMNTSHMEQEAQYSRLFIVCGKGCSIELVRNSFSKYGNIKDVWFLKDKQTGEQKGVVFVRYNKASEAFLAVEAMNGRIMEGHPKPLKVLIAAQKAYGTGESGDKRDEDPNNRLFVSCPKTFDDDDLLRTFQVFGDVDNAHVLKDRQTGKNKGSGFVKFHRPYHAAMALENCEESYKARFADRRPSNKREREDSHSGNFSDRGSFSRGSDRSAHYQQQSLGGQSMFSGQSIQTGGGASFRSHSGQSTCCLSVLTNNTVSEDQIKRIFDIAPDFEYCRLDRTSGVAFVKYGNPAAAEYAQRKLDGVEYPVGFRLAARFADAASEMNMSVLDAQRNLSNLMQNPSGSNLQVLLETIQKATSVLQNAGTTGVGLQNSGGLGGLGGGIQNSGGMGGLGGGMQNSFNSSAMLDMPPCQCSASLPPKQPLVGKDASLSKQLFLVFQQGNIRDKVLTDIFCRFGNLIEAYMVSGKTFGFAKYATDESADQAREALHLQRIDGQLIKVFEGDPDKYKDRKRMKAEHEESSSSVSPVDESW